MSIEQDAGGIQREPGDSKNNTGNAPGEIDRLLQSARDAQFTGRGRLAIHLYCAAFELSNELSGKPSSATIEGLRKAWMLACEQGDRQSAETIFNDLLPYNTNDQTHNAVLALQDLALRQLTELGVSKDDLTQIAAQINAAAPDLASTAHNALALPSRLTKTQRQEDRLNYASLAGFGSSLREMRQFGFATPDDLVFQEFITQTQAFHGISGPVLSEAFLFHGPSRDDTALFALATAGEIGRPVVSMEVDVDSSGNGVIRVQGPMRRPMFGPPRITDLPTECTLVIQNIDTLQGLFQNEDRATGAAKGAHGSSCSSGASCPAPVGSPHGRSMKAEVLGYLNAMRAHGDVFIIATAAASLATDPHMLGDSLLSVVGPLRNIEIKHPNFDERYDVINSLAEEHISFKEVGQRWLAAMTDGLSRFGIVDVCRSAIEEAYRESLRFSRHQMVTADMVLNELLGALDRSSQAYQDVEDIIVERFNKDLFDELGI